MLHFNAPFFPLKRSVSPKKSLKCSVNAHTYGFYIYIILTFQHNLQISVPNKIVYLVQQVNNNVCKSFNTPEDDSLNDPLFSDS